MRNTITRTFNSNVCTCAVYKDGKISVAKITIPYGFNTVESAENYIRRNVDLDGAKLAAVEHVEKVSRMYGMDEATFIENARIVDERSKDTRNCITKTVVANIGKLIYMDTNRKICEKQVSVDIKRNLDKQARELVPDGCIGITIEGISECTALYAMSEADFIKYARPMVDHQHYKA